jgi:hypothetical protein
VTTPVPSHCRSGRCGNQVPGSARTTRPRRIRPDLPHLTSSQNWLIALAISGPRQTTASSSLGRSRLMDMIAIPDLDWTGFSPASSPVGLSVMPNILGMLGPVMSASSMPTSRPARRQGRVHARSRRPGRCTRAGRHDCPLLLAAGTTSGDSRLCSRTQCLGHSHQKWDSDQVDCHHDDEHIQRAKTVPDDP